MEWLTDSLEGTETWLKVHMEELAGATKTKENLQGKRLHRCKREVRALMDTKTRHDLTKRARKVVKKGMKIRLREQNRK